MFFVYSGFRVDGTNMHKPSCLLDVGRAEKPAAGERNRHIIYKEFRPERQAIKYCTLGLVVSG